MRQNLGRQAALIALSLWCALTVVAGPLRAETNHFDIGVVLASNGKPVLQDTSGRIASSAVMQSIHEDDVIFFNVGDTVTICNEVLGSTFAIDGPGTVRVTRSGIVSVAGSPDIRNAGPCEAGSAGNTNGGVLLRKLMQDKH